MDRFEDLQTFVAVVETGSFTAAADRLNLRAPFAGIVDKVDVELGEWVQTGTPIATVLSGLAQSNCAVS